MRIVSVRGGRVDDGRTTCDVVEVDWCRPGRELLRLTRGHRWTCGNSCRTQQYRQVNPESSSHVSSSFLSITVRVATFEEARSSVNPACLSSLSHASPDGTDWWTSAWIATPVVRIPAHHLPRVVHFSTSE